MQNHTPSSLHHWHHFVDGYMLFRRVRCFFIVSGWLQYLSFPITWLLCVLVNGISSFQTDFEIEWSFIIPLSSTKLFCTSLAILIQDKVFLELIITSCSWVCPQCIYMCCIKSTKMCVERRVRMQFKSNTLFRTFSIQKKHFTFGITCLIFNENSYRVNKMKLQLSVLLSCLLLNIGK